MSLSIGIKVKGQKEATAAIDKVKQNRSQTNQKALTEVANNFVKAAKDRAHVITGNMRDNIVAEEIDGRTGHAIVEARAEYSVYENARGGSHAFWSRAIGYTQRTGTATIKRHMDAAFKSAGVPLK